MARERFFGAKAQGSFYFTNATILDGETITIGDKVYEFDTPDGVVAGHVAVSIASGTAAGIAAAFLAAVNANKPSVPVTAFANPTDNKQVHIIADAPGTAGNLAIAETVANAGLVISGANLVGGENAGTQTYHRGEYVVTASDVTATCAIIETNLVSPRFAKVEVRDTNGGPKYITDRITITGSKIKILQNGATHLAATDIVEWAAWE